MDWIILLLVLLYPFVMLILVLAYDIYNPSNAFQEFSEAIEEVKRQIGYVLEPTFIKICDELNKILYNEETEK